MSVEIKTILTSCEECGKDSEKRAFVCPGCKNIIVVSHDGPLNYCGECGFKLG